MKTPKELWETYLYKGATKEWLLSHTELIKRSALDLKEKHPAIYREQMDYIIDLWKKKIFHVCPSIKPIEVFNKTVEQITELAISRGHKKDELPNFQDIARFWMLRRIAEISD